MSDEQEHTQTFTGYLAELIRLQAERIGKTPQDYILSFFEKRCNAPDFAAIGFRSISPKSNIFHH